jgi:hypothetical protein
MTNQVTSENLGTCEDYCECADYDGVDAKQHESCVDGRCAYGKCYDKAVDGDYCPCHTEPK